MFSPGWHHKWLVVALLLGWVFLNRFRLLGIALGKLLTLKLAHDRDAAPLQITVRVERVTLQPLRVVNVELSSSDRWRLEVSKITLRSFVREFFRSFGQVRILALEFDSVKAVVGSLDSEYVGKFLEQRRRSSKPSSGTHSPPSATFSTKVSPLAFFRFVDFRVQDIQLQMQWKGIASSFQCRDLYVGITDVFTSLNLIQLSARVSALAISSHSAATVASELCDATRSGVWLRLPGASTRCDFDLGSLQLLGCMFNGVPEQGLEVGCNANFVEMLACAYSELVQRDVMVDPTAHGSAVRQDAEPARVLPRLEVIDLWLRVQGSSYDELYHDSNMVVSAEIHRLVVECQRGVDPLTEKASSEENCDDPQPGRTNIPVTCVNAVVKNIRALVGDDPCDCLLDISSLELQVKQSGVNEHRRVVTTIEACTLHMSPRAEENLCGLLAARHRIEGLQRRYSDPNSERGESNGEHAAGKTTMARVMDLELHVQTWRAVCEVYTKSDECRRSQIDCEGADCTIRSTIERGEVSRDKHNVSVRSVKAEVTFSSSCSTAASVHSATFSRVDIAITKTIQHLPHTRNASIVAHFGEVNVNEYLEQSVTRQVQAPALPAALFRDLTISQDEHVSSDVTETLVAVQVDELGVDWSHRHHADFLAPIQKLESVVESIDRMISLESSKQQPRSTPRRSSGIIGDPDKIPKVTGISLAPRCSTIRLHDVADIARCITLKLLDTTLRHKKTHLEVTTSLECALIHLLWSEAALPAVEVVALAFSQRALLGRQRFMVETPTQSSIAMASTKVFMYPGRKLLALLLQLEALSNADSEQRAESLQVSKSRPTAQSMSIDCAELVLEAFYDNTLSPQAPAAAPSDSAMQSYLIELSQFNIKLTKSSLSESSDAIARFIQRLQGPAAGSGGDLSTRSFAELVRKAGTMEGVARAQSIVLLRREPTGRFAVCREVEIHFALTDVEWQRLVTFEEEPNRQTDSTEDSLRTLIFDASIFSESILATVVKRELDDSFRVLRTIQESMDTQETGNCNCGLADGESAVGDQQKTNFRFRFAGNVDVGIQKWTLDFPYGGSNPSVSYAANRVGVDGEKLMRVVVNEVVVTTRQFLRMSLQFDSMAVYLISHESPHLEDSVSPQTDDLEGTMEDCVRLVFLPAVCINTLLHWQDEWIRTSLPQPRTPQQLSVSVDIGLRQHPALCAWPSGAVPSMNEALLSLNWDYVYPWLIYMVTDDEDTGIAIPDVSEDAEAIDAERAICCNGIQWDMSLGTIQAVWWDGITQEQAIMLVAGEFVSHGIVLRSECLSPSSTTSKSANRTGIRQPAANASVWTVIDLTLYLDRLHGYLLHEPAASSFPRAPSSAAGTGDNLADEEDAIPFDRVNNLEFFWETMGTSYRLVATNDAESGDIDDSLSSLFSEPISPVTDKMHDGFVPIDYGFSLNAASKLRKLDSLTRSPSMHISALTINTGASASSVTSPPSPRAGKHWSHTIRRRLSRLKRRTASMDNLLLNDGSCPIQVDSMKLLWTLETRDAVFYMVAVLVDSLQLLHDAMDQRRQQQQQSSNGAVAVAVVGECPEPAEDLDPVVRPPEIVRTSSKSVEETNSAGAAEVPSAQPDARLGRRGSTRDTLLDLLMQGKLGTKAASDLPVDNDGTHRQPSATKGDSEQDDAEAGEIAIKQYTVDIHDVQINMRDDNSRSSVLVAADRIHLEVGLDALRTKSVVKLTFDVVTGHVAPVDVDIAAPVLWYTNAAGVGSGSSSRRFSSSPTSAASSSPSSLLKQVLEECSLSSTYTQMRVGGASSIDADLSFLQVTADRHQFYQMLYVMRHVLLAPPATVIRGRSRRAQTAGPRPSRGECVGSPQPADGGSAHGSPMPTGVPNKKLYAQMVEELRARELKTLNTSGRTKSAAVAFRSIAFRALGLQMRLRLSPEVAGADYEFVEIRAEGLTGSHTYYVNQCTKFVLNLQWMEITNLRPGQSSIAFEDAMSVLRAKLLVEERLHHPSGSGSTSKSTPESFSSPSRLASYQKGMLSVRAESGPVVRVLGQKLRVLDVLEVSMFPEVANMIVIQLAADFYDLVCKFFFAQTVAPEASKELTSEQLLFGRNLNNGSSGSGANCSSGSNGSCSTPTASGNNSGGSSAGGGILSSPSIRSRLQSPSLLVSSASSRRRSVQVSSSTSVSSASCSNTDTSASSSADTGDDDDNGSSSETDGCELFFFKYVRFGNVRLRINCNGFFVNLNNFDLDLPPFVCQSRLYTGQKLLQKFESHLKWYVTKESASSGLSQFKNRLLKWTPSGSLSLSSSSSSSSGGVSGNDKKDRTKRQESEDVATLNAQVLFGPYSGATT